MDNNDFLKSLSKSLIEATKTVLEGKTHTVPKTEKEKKLAALADPKDKITHADVLKGRGVVKEEEQIDELSRKTMTSYIKSASGEIRDAADKRRKFMPWENDKDPDIRSIGRKRVSGAEKTIDKRMKGTSMAASKLAKEEVEQVDEISKELTRSYFNKALDSGVRAASRQWRHGSASDANAAAAVAKKRAKGLGMAKDRLYKEEVEVNTLEEAMNAADRFKHHHDHAKALLKSISDHLKSEHEAATKHTDYRGNKGPHWGHVGSMEHVANQLSNIHDMLARKGEYAESVEVEDEVTLTEAELQALEQIAETIEVEETEELDEARGRPKLPRDAQGNIIRGGAKAKASVAKADEEPAALGYQLRKAASINKPVHFMNGEKKNVTSHHINAFNDHMAARKTAAEKAAFQAKAHKSHDEFVKAVSAPVPKATKDTGEIVKYRH